MILGSNFNNIKENGELLKAQVIETYDSNGDMSDSSYTMLEIIDETSFYKIINYKWRFFINWCKEHSSL